MTVAYQSMKPRLPSEISEAAFRGFLHADGWSVLPILKQAVPVGAVLIKGNEVHIEMPEPGPWVLRAIREYLHAVVDAHGVAMTHLPASDTRALRFVTRLGFVEVGRDREELILHCSEKRYERRH